MSGSRTESGSDPGGEAAELLRRCALRDKAAFRLLYDRWSGRMHGLALRITRQSSLAADATHDAFMQIWQQAGRFDPARGSAEAFLVTIVRYRALDILRRGSREVVGYEPAVEQADPTPDALAQLTETMDGAALHRCLQTLPEDRRKLVIMAFVEGLSHSELAARTGAPLGTLKSWIRRSLLSLRECLAA